MKQEIHLALALIWVGLTAWGGSPESGRDAVRRPVAVVGGGSAGFGAALAAAELGVDVVLVEKSPTARPCGSPATAR